MRWHDSSGTSTRGARSAEQRLVMTDAKSDTYAIARLVLSRIAHPVAIIGAAHEGERSCATGTTMYVSLAPAMIAVAEHHGSRTTRLIRDSGQFSVSLLHDSQQELAAAAGETAAGAGQ